MDALSHYFAELFVHTFEPDIVKNNCSSMLAAMTEELARVHQTLEIDRIGKPISNRKFSVEAWPSGLRQPSEKRLSGVTDAPRVRIPPL